MKSQTAQSRSLFETAENAEEKGDYQQALRLYAQAIAVDRSDPSPRFRLALLQLQQGEWRESLKTARQIIRRWPDRDAYILVGQNYLNLRQLHRAEQAFRQSLAVRARPWNWVFLGFTLYRLGQKEESQECYRKALKLDPKYEEAHYNLGCSYKLQKQYTKAEKHLRKAIALNPKYALAYAELGAVLNHKENTLKEAAQVLRKSIRLNPNYGWARVYLANCLWQLDKLKAANEQYLKVIELWPDYSLSYWTYGDFLSSTSKNAELGEKYLRRAIELDSKDTRANYYLGDHLLRQEKIIEAKSFLKRAARNGHERAKRLLEDYKVCGLLTSFQ